MRRGGATWLWLAVPLVGWLELGAHVQTSRAAPSLDAWAQAKPTLAELKQPADLVVIAPQWAEPNARHAFGDELMPLEHLARPDESAFARAIEVSILGQESPLLEGWSVEHERTQGAFRFRVRTNPQHRPVVFDFLAHVSPERARAFSGPKEARRSCAWKANAPLRNGGLGGSPTFPRQRFVCPSGDPYSVGVTVIDDHQEFRPRRCIWAHPTSNGVIGLEFDRVPLGKVLRGYSGMPWLLERSLQGPPIRLSVFVDDTLVGSAEHRDGDGWKGFELDLGAHAGKSAAKVRFEVSSATPKDRHFCFQADTR